MDRKTLTPQQQCEAKEYLHIMHQRQKLPFMWPSELTLKDWSSSDIGRLTNSEVLASDVPLGTNMGNILKRYALS